MLIRRDHGGFSVYSNPYHQEVLGIQKFREYGLHSKFLSHKIKYEIVKEVETKTLMATAGEEKGWIYVIFKDSEGYKYILRRPSNQTENLENWGFYYV